jgi:hypothetical protein
MFHEPAPLGRLFLSTRERWPYLVFFARIALTAFGSAYYHLRPATGRLVWDRLPMTHGEPQAPSFRAG